MSETVWGFFYGGLINPDVMTRVGFRPRSEITASLAGFDIRISPLVNLVPDPQAIVFGRLFETTHSELKHVYGQLAAEYYPYPVLAQDAESRFVPALCYIVPDMPPGQANADHIAPLLATAMQLGFPTWYLDKIRAFLRA